MVASRQVEIPFYGGIGQLRGLGFGALEQGIRITAIPCLRKYIVPATKRVCADLLEPAVPGIAFVVSGRKKFKTTVRSVGRQTLRKQLGSGGRKGNASRIIPTESAKLANRLRRDIFANISHYSYRVIFNTNLCGSLSKPWRESPSS